MYCNCNLSYKWILFIALFALLESCSNEGYDALVNRDQEKPCAVILFSEENFEGDEIELGGSRSYSNLDDLAGSGGKNWTGKARSFTVGQEATVMAWPHRNYRGDSIVYPAGKYPSVIEPGSISIYCERTASE